MPKAKTYDFKQVEEKWKKYWEKEKIYEFDPKSRKKIYSIDTPPPYISGAMHIGHAFSYSQQDFIVRFKRMSGVTVFYPFGTDDNGLPTERFIEKVNKVKSNSMGRSNFIELCLKTLNKVTPECIQDFVNLGISADYELYYSTIDKNSQKIAQQSFIELYEKGDAYKKEFPTLWCPECQTSIAQAELEDKEKQTLFSTLKFKVGDKELFIATTRPELLGSCVAVFVHPNDKRYKNFVGKKAKVALFNYEVPIIADESADLKKGTGALMVCSYGDRFDVDAIQRYKLEPRIVIDESGKIKQGNYSGLKIEQARKKILEDLKRNELVKEQKSINHVVNVHDKCGTPIEFIPTEQWFIKILDKKKIWLQKGKEINWYPKYMYKRYENWIRGLEWDWSISRDRHFGVPIPVWFCSKCDKIIFPEKSELPIDPIQTKKKCSCGGEAIPEKKVFDTWMTSSLTPQIAAGLTKNVHIPFSLRPQGHDIIRTWAFYTIVKSHLHEKKIPWKDIVISGNVSLGGEKMSKSKGNVVKPQDIMEKFGSDALRFWAAGSKLGGDLGYQEKDLVTGKKFITKLFNASNFVFMNLEGYKPKKTKLLETDRLFLSKLNALIEICTKAFESYEYNRVRLEVSNFFWHLFCDNYLELVKKRVYTGTKQEKESAFFTLYNSLLIILKLISPITPFITEEIYQNFFKENEKDKSIHISEWPKRIIINQNKEDNKTFEILNDRLIKIRTEKTKAKKPMNAEIILTLDKEDHMSLRDVLVDLKSVTNAKEVKTGEFKVDFV